MTTFECAVIADIDQAVALFNKLREHDPYRIDNMDTFSNLLYVKVRPFFKRLKCKRNKKKMDHFFAVRPQIMKPELSYLAHTLVEIDKYRVETCCVIGTH